MSETVLMKTHLIVTDVHDEYNIKWCKSIRETNPKLNNGLPIFVIIGDKGRMELNTTDMLRVEECAKLLTRPRGREATTTGHSRIYIKEENDKEKLLGVLIHNHIKTFAPMFDMVEIG